MNSEGKRRNRRRSDKTYIEQCYIAAQSLPLVSPSMDGRSMGRAAVGSAP